MKNALIGTISYFLKYDYAPTFGEVYTFYPKKISRNALFSKLTLLLKEKKIIALLKDYHDNANRYTIQGYSTILKSSKSKIQIAKSKRKKIGGYLRVLSKLPQIEFVGLSGTVAMGNSEKGDDIDLFIISSRGRLFTARAIVLVLAEIIGKRRQRRGLLVKDMICPNLFFDGSDSVIPKAKRTERVAREILQMKAILVKNDRDKQFLYENQWIYRFFPNARRVRQYKAVRSAIVLPKAVGDWVEELFKDIQLFFINRHRTNEYITPTQLWFHPGKTKPA